MSNNGWLCVENVYDRYIKKQNGRYNKNAL